MCPPCDPMPPLPPMYTRHYAAGDLVPGSFGTVFTDEHLNAMAAWFQRAHQLLSQVDALLATGPTPVAFSLMRLALEDARHELVTLNGLVAADGAAPDERFSIDTTAVIRTIDRALSGASCTDSRPS